MNTKLVQKLKELPRTPGVYLFRNESARVIYVGKAVNLKNRVSSYFQKKDHDPKTAELVKKIERLEYIESGSEFEALVLEADLIKRYKPKYNIRFRDDKNYVYLKVTKEDYPKISIVHQITDHKAEYLGPYTDSNAVRRILKISRRIFPYCTCKLPNDEVCLYFHIGLCPGHGEKYISSSDYKKNIRGIEKIFSGKTGALKREFTGEMKKASKEKRYEEAAACRDNIKYLERIERSHIISERDLSEDKGLYELKKHLNLPVIPQKIECFDISNIMGTAATGSMVVFGSGIASPKDYRRFQIKTVKGANDTQMMAEILSRRFSLGEKKKKDSAFSQLPDLVILDGGKGQLSAVLEKVGDTGETRIVSLAKKREEIFVKEDKGFRKIIMPKNSEALYLVQRIRDEAHRFAITYHRKLKGRESFRTALDDIMGIGPVTKKKLIAHFGTIENMRKANEKEIAGLVGESLAKKIKENL